MSYHRRRYFLPWLARWASADSMVLADGVNPFRYAQNSPLVGIDVSGQATNESRVKKVT